MQKSLLIWAAAASLFLSGCAAPEPGEVRAGRLGTVSMVSSNSGTQIEGVSEGYWDWVAAASVDAFSRPDAVPHDIALDKAQVLAGLARLMRQRDGVLWIGHATVLVRIAGVTILTDPVFSDRLSPLPGLGPKRYRPPALSVDELPPVDAVLVSHSHLDHLDELSLHALAKRFPAAKVIVPEGMEGMATAAGFTVVRGAHAGSEYVVGGAQIMALPVYHVASRSGLDAGLTPALSFSLRQAAGPAVFFSGDTGYGPFFKRVRRVLGRHHLVLVPVGDFTPRSEVGHVHVSPEEAVRIARDLGASVAVGMHWGTFPLSPEPPGEPRDRFLAAGPGLARALRIGQTMIVPASRPRRP